MGSRAGTLANTIPDDPFDLKRPQLSDIGIDRASRETKGKDKDDDHAARGRSNRTSLAPDITREHPPGLHQEEDEEEDIEDDEEDEKVPRKATNPIMSPASCSP